MNRKPLKRHAALIPLSREHHKGLLLAQLLKSDSPPYRGLPTERADIIDYAKKEYQDKLLPHFEKEETLIRRSLQEQGTLADHAQRVIQEHEQLRAAFTQLNEATTVSELDKLGRLLEQHIRFEERVWFMALQEELSETELQQLYL
jgi:hemerythrin-like domain-containing protein